MGNSVPESHAFTAGLFKAGKGHRNLREVLRPLCYYCSRKFHSVLVIQEWTFSYKLWFHVTLPCHGFKLSVYKMTATMS